MGKRLTRKESSLSGIALLSVMVVIASISATAGWLLYSQYIDIQRTTRVLEKEQAFLFGLTMEDLARAMLTKEALYSNNREAYVDFYIDKLSQGQAWSNTALLDFNALASQAAFIGVSKLDIKIYDLQGFFDINNIRRTTDSCKSEDKNIPNEMQPRQLSLKIFEELLKKKIDFTKFGDDQFKYTHLRDGVRDWLDENDSALGDGAEDATYSLSDIPYRAANAYISTIEELYFINGFRELPTAQFKSLSRYLTALPYAPRPGCPLPMNVLTLPPELLEIAIKSLHPVFKESASQKARELKEGLCKPVIKDSNQMKAVFAAVLPKDIEDKKVQSLIKLWADQLAQRMFDVSSRYFAVQILFEYAKQPFQMTSVFYLRRGAKQDEDLPPVQLLTRRLATTELKSWNFHGAGHDALCPIKEEEEDEV